MFSSLLSGGTSNDAQNRTNASAQTAPAPSDLTSILPTPTLRVELALLFLLSTDAMRQDLLAVFEPPALDASTAACDLVTLDDEAPSAQQVRNQQRQRGERWAARVAQRGRELGTSEMLGLRRAGVTHFDAWRARVLARVCEGLGVRADVVKRARREGVERRAREEEKRKGRDLVSLACEDDVKSQEGESEKGKWF
jgi:hypothetical protein